MQRYLVPLLIGLFVLACPVVVAELGGFELYTSQWHTTATSNVGEQKAQTADESASCALSSKLEISEPVWDASDWLGYVQSHRGRVTAELTWETTCGRSGDAKLEITTDVECRGLVSIEKCRSAIHAEVDKRIAAVLTERQL